MTIDGVNYRLTKHGRQQFLDRVGQMSDADMIHAAVRGRTGFKFVWVSDESAGEGLRLVTVLRGGNLRAIPKSLVGDAVEHHPDRRIYREVSQYHVGDPRKRTGKRWIRAPMGSAIEADDRWRR